jgi:hypothetical protein
VGKILAGIGGRKAYRCLSALSTDHFDLNFWDSEQRAPGAQHQTKRHVTQRRVAFERRPSLTQLHRAKREQLVNMPPKIEVKLEKREYVHPEASHAKKK